MGRKPKSEEPVYSRLEAVRTEQGITRQELADEVEVHYQTIGYLERGEYSPSLSLALKIARRLETPVGELFSLTPFTTPLTDPIHDHIHDATADTGRIR